MNRLRETQQAASEITTKLDEKETLCLRMAEEEQALACEVEMLKMEIDRLK